MQPIRFRKAVASILVLGVLVAAVPAFAAATPSGEGGRAVENGPSVVDTVVGWLVGLLPASWLPPGPAAARGSSTVEAALGPDADPDGGVLAGPDSTSGDPTADPELGSGLDPDG